MNHRNLKPFLPQRLSADGCRAACGCADDGRLQAILDMAVEGIIVIDEVGTITTVNKAASRMFGYDDDELLGQSINVLLPPAHRGRHDQYMSNYLRTGRGKIIGHGRETVGLRKDGSEFPIELAVSDVRHEGGRCFTGIVRDISNRKRLEKAILDVSELEQRRIGNQLHDGLCQELAGIAYVTQMIHHKLQEGKTIEEGAFANVATLLADAVKRARSLAHGLQPIEKIPTGLAGALRRLAADISQMSSVKCQFRSRGDVGLSDPVIATHLFRIAQATVRNALSDDNARRIVISLSGTVGELHLAINDNLSRPAGTPVFSDEMAYQMVCHRAKVIGARICFIRQKRGGTQLSCKVSSSKAA